MLRGRKSELRAQLILCELNSFVNQFFGGPTTKTHIHEIYRVRERQRPAKNARCVHFTSFFSMFGPNFFAIEFQAKYITLGEREFYR